MKKEKKSTKQQPEQEKTVFDSLEPRQKVFILEYLKDFNGTQAAIRAGYSKRSATVISAQNLIKANIKEALKQKINEILEDKELLLLQTRRELERVAFADIKEFIDFDKNLKLNITNKSDTRPIESVQIDNTMSKDKQFVYQSVKFKMHSKLKALEDLGKMLGVISDNQGGNIYFVTSQDYLPVIPDGTDSDNKS